MLLALTLHPELRCTARSRRSGWQQCGRLAAYGSRVCTTHGARKIPRFGRDAPNYKHGHRSEEAILKTRHARQRLKHLATGVELINAAPAPVTTGLKDEIVKFVTDEAALTLRQRTELASIEAKSRPAADVKPRRSS